MEERVEPLEVAFDVDPGLDELDEPGAGIVGRLGAVDAFVAAARSHRRRLRPLSRPARDPGRPEDGAAQERRSLRVTMPAV